MECFVYPRVFFRFVFNHDQCITMVAYIPKRYRSVILLSSSHCSASIDETTGDSRKPSMITDYNRTKGGVDTLDENVETFTCRRKTCRWPLLLYYNLLDVAAYNAYIVMVKNGYSGNRSDFIRELTLQMAAPSMHSRFRQQKVSSNTKACIRTICNLMPEMQPANAATYNPGHCKLCRKSTRSRCDECGRYCCKFHSASFKQTKCSDCID